MRHVPLSNMFLLISLIGLMISVFLTLQGLLSETWAFLLILIFILFVTASFVSAAPDDQDVKLE